ncbi:hypothetical protein BDV23DRAFT_182302 [Aspergillus alliaceus]|uniref:Uncharacterized protein n=1 Tax=Petromyces alliaceus TaxID=209559 RepID=A0A5N7CC35_PETAA|nr:hypothetical protein BDV23DRAFT_182302 [Aspergillus alliaceus]
MEDVESPQFPAEFDHEDWNPSGIPTREKPNYILTFADSPSVQLAVARLSFKKSSVGGDFSGNGFFINIPSIQRRFILTAGHNLIEVTGQRIRDLVMDPGFGMVLKLAYEERLDCELCVTGIRSSKSTEHAVTSSGQCMNPIFNENQLEYTAETEKGISGSPMWIIYDGSPTAVAIQYVYSRSSVSYLLLDQCEKCNQAIKVDSDTALPLYLTFSETDKLLGVVVKEADNPALMLFNILPAYAPYKGMGKEVGKGLPACFGIYRSRDEHVQWDSWNLDFTTATLVNDLR